MSIHGLSRWIGMALLSVSLTGHGALAQERTDGQGVVLPPTATVLEGIPSVRIDSSEGVTTRRQLDKAEATKDRLKISVIDGQYYWTSRGNRLLRLDSAGPYTYLSSQPGHYIRFTRIKDRIAYVEHVDVDLGSVTWWGELTIAVGGKR